MPDLDTGPYGYVQIRWPITGATIDISLYDPGPPERILHRSVLWTPWLGWDVEIAFRQMARDLAEETAGA